MRSFNHSSRIPRDSMRNNYLKFVLFFVQTLSLNLARLCAGGDGDGIWRNLLNTVQVENRQPPKTGDR